MNWSVGTLPVTRKIAEEPSVLPKIRGAVTAGFAGLTKLRPAGPTAQPAACLALKALR